MIATKKNPIPGRLASLREYMAEKQVDACVVPTDDVHQSEYVSPHFQYRSWLSGFTGSAGVLVVTQEEAGLWTDSRYYLQAGQELEGSGIVLYGTTLPDTPSIEQWLADRHLQTVGFDGEVYAAGKGLALEDALEKTGCRTDAHFRSYEAVWTDRPPLPEGKFFVYEERYAGESFVSKLERLRERLQISGADVLPVSGLDDVAWLFNLRGSDVDYAPVGLAFALIEKERVRFFAEPSKLTPQVRRYLRANQVEMRPYDGLYAALRRLPAGSRVFTDLQRINYAIFRAISRRCVKVSGISPLTDMKSVKNPVELAGFKKAVLKDGVTLLRLWKWMEEKVGRGEPLDEYAIAEHLTTSRRSGADCFGESFEPIVSFNANGAIVHYSPSPESSAPVGKNGILLIDSGGQYIEGTTDITRTYSFYEGDATPDAYRKDYACVLKGNIALSECVFPDRARGCMVDALARQFLWREGLHYGHGTGHGIGHFLNVHEGPQSIRMEENPVPLKPGMVISNEPGLYRTGVYGIRLENMIACTEKFTTDFGTFNGFETLTLFPFDLKSIDRKYYSEEEISWINTYHQRTFTAFAPLLTEEERKWLEEKTKNI